MSIVGEATGVLGLLGKAWNLLRDRLDPARAQAMRLIETFEAYGIARQQIPRLLPDDLKLPNAAFSIPDKLKDKLTPELLDWAAEHLAISRSWLDHVSKKPHLMEDHYKAPSGYRDWLSQRLELAPDVHRFLSVWKPPGEELPGAHGPLCLIYQETSDGLDGSEFTRYWLLSDKWSYDHPPCLHNLVAVIAIARSLGIWVLGRNVPITQLEQLERGKLLIPEVVNQYVREQWHPVDLIDPPPGRDTEWRRALWEDAQAYLARDGIEMSNLSRASGGMKSVEHMT
ncbi:MAG: hypothetical protein R3E99_10670 [Burkholderiaceae bacterium]